MEKVDVLLPPNFQKSGVTKTREQAVVDGDWLGGFHLWIVRTEPHLALLFQRRSRNKPTFPSQLDVSAAGHYQAGETVKNGLREVKEELGKDYHFGQLTYLGKKVFVDFDMKNRKLQTVCDVFITIDNISLSSFNLQPEEVASLLIINITDLEQVFTKENYTFISQGVNLHKQPITETISREDFIDNWDNYQYKMALLSRRFVRGEKNLLY
jgi:isopentenyldiphosphate isomerase